MDKLFLYKGVFMKNLDIYIYIVSLILFLSAGFYYVMFDVFYNMACKERDKNISKYGSAARSGGSGIVYDKDKKTVVPSVSVINCERKVEYWRKINPKRIGAGLAFRHFVVFNLISILLTTVIFLFNGGIN